MVELELTETDPGYLCGRLLALLARIQELAILRPTTSLIDRYYGAACATPAYAFSSLMKLVQTHLSKLERDYPGAYYALQQELEQLLLQLKKFPMLLTQEQQAMFSLGYYHQRAHFRAQSAEWKKKAKGKRSDTSDTSFDEGEGGAAEAEEKESGVEGES
jgi:CRISPR-associated protein Csd1